MAWVETIDGAINLERVDALITTVSSDRGDEIAEDVYQAINTTVSVTAVQGDKTHDVILLSAAGGYSDLHDAMDKATHIIQYLASLATSTLYLKHMDIDKMLEGNK